MREEEIDTSTIVKVYCRVFIWEAVRNTGTINLAKAKSCLLLLIVSPILIPNAFLITFVPPETMRQVFTSMICSTHMRTHGFA